MESLLIAVLLFVAFGLAMMTALTYRCAKFAKNGIRRLCRK